VSTPANPAAGSYKLLNRGGSFLVRNSSGTEVPIASAAAQSVNIRASEGAGTTTLTNADIKYQRFNLSAARTVVLPTTSVLAGDVWQMINPNQFRLTIEASDNSDIIWSWGDKVTLVALINTPVTNTDWAVIDKTIIVGRLPTSVTPTISASFGTTSSEQFWWKRIDNMMNFYGSFIIGTTTAALASVSVPLGLQIDPGYLPSEGKNHLGDAFCIISGTSVAYPVNSKVVSIFEPSATDTDIYFATTVNPGNPMYDAQNASSMTATPGDMFGFNVMIPILQWREL